MKRIAVVGVPGGWSSEYLADTIGEITGFRLLLDMSRVSLDLDTGKAWFRGDGQKVAVDELDALILKKMGASYSPDLLDRLEVLNFLADRGLAIFSHPRRVQRVLDRLACTVGLKLAGIPMPPTTITEDPAQALAALKQYGQAVLKPLYSTKARGMLVVEDGPEAAEIISDFQAHGHPTIYMQRIVELGEMDLGVVFLGGEYYATYARTKQNDSWNTTTRSGGRYRPFDPEPEIIELARRAQEPFGLDFTCVDVALTPDGPVIFEVSAFGGFRGLKEANGLDAAADYTNYVLQRISR